MSTPFESATLNLKLFELRREPVLRQARAWFLWEFNPENFASLVAEISGPHNAEFRMVISYWEMACSLVTSGAIESGAFLAAHGEIVATFSKLHPFLPELRATVREPDLCRHMQTVVLSAPDMEATLQRRRDAIVSASRPPATADYSSGSFSVSELTSE